LESLKDIESEHAGRAEQQHRDPIGLPVHFLGRSYRAEPVARPLYRTKDRIKWSRRAFKDACHIPTEGLHHCEEDEEEQSDLKKLVQSRVDL